MTTNWRITTRQKVVLFLLSLIATIGLLISFSGYARIFAIQVAPEWEARTHAANDQEDQKTFFDLFPEYAKDVIRGDTGSALVVQGCGNSYNSSTKVCGGTYECYLIYSAYPLDIEFANSAGPTVKAQSGQNFGRYSSENSCDQAKTTFPNINTNSYIGFPNIGEVFWSFPLMYNINSISYSSTYEGLEAGMPEPEIGEFTQFLLPPDLCENIPGWQEEIPEGFISDEENCVNETVGSGETPEFGEREIKLLSAGMTIVLAGIIIYQFRWRGTA